MKLKALSVVICLALCFSLFVAFLGPAATVIDVRAEDAGGCHAYINGVDVSSYDTPDHALDVDVNESLRVSVVSPVPFVSHKVDMAFMDLFSWTVSEETDTGTETSYETTVNVADYADYGIGLYKVTGTGVLENGATCSTVVFVAVGGRSAVSTVAGIIGLVMAIFGILGLIVLVILMWLGILGSPSWFGCLGALPVALLLTPVAMVTGGAQEPSSGADQTGGGQGTREVPSGSQGGSGGHAKFRLKVSILAIACALLSAIGFVVLFQQMGVMYPTITVVVVSLVLGLVVGIALPTLAVTFSRRRK
jgi:hypothetical protein